MSIYEMCPRKRIFITAAAAVMALLVFSPCVPAASIIIVGNYNWSYDGIAIGPYLASVNGGPNVSVFCMDLHTDTYVNTVYSGSLSTPDTPAAEEAAFLASYSLYLGAPASDTRTVNSVEGPIAMAIWQLMGTLGGTAPDPAAQPFIQLAQQAYANHLITPAFLSQVSVWTPDTGVTSQRFVTAARDDDMIKSVVPEPGTAITLGAGVLLCIAAFAWRRPKPASYSCSQIR